MKLFVLFLVLSCQQCLTVSHRRPSLFAEQPACDLVTSQPVFLSRLGVENGKEACVVAKS